MGLQEGQWARGGITANQALTQAKLNLDFDVIVLLPALGQCSRSTPKI